MEKPTKKYAVIIKDGLSGGKAINMASHLSGQLGSLVPELGGREVLDASGIKHAGLPIYPNVILTATPEELASAVAKARAMADCNEILFLDYPEQGFSTSTDDEYRAAIALVNTEAIVIEGCLIYGLRQAVNSVTKGLRLWQ